jgi:GTPase Era involved in 16S rRNA processing
VTAASTVDPATRPDDAAAAADVRALLDRAVEVYGDDPVAHRLRDQRRRLDDPLRVALVGRVKAGKSTLLNALVGARIAPTDAGECTKVVTLYRNGATPRVLLHDTAGAVRTLPVRRSADGLHLDLAGTPAEQVAFLAVDWPATGLVPATLIDTPGLASLTAAASARTESFFDSGEHVPGADAVVFLTRQMQAEDLAFLAAFQAATGAGDVHTTTITVLSRADEIASGRLDALRAADAVAQRMAGDPAVRAVSDTVVPVAGLLALGARTLRQGDFVALRTIARAQPDDLRTLLLSADRFCRPEVPVPVSREVRVALVERLGLFGIRLSITLIRSGLTDAQSLADELQRRSGLAELQRLIAVHFTRRGGVLKVETALRTLETVLRERPTAGDADLWRELERIRLASHDLDELALLARSRAPDGPLPGALRAEGERLLGAEGPETTVRLGLPAGAPDEAVRAAAADAIDRWRAAGADPLAPRATLDAIDVVVRACEQILGGLDGQASAVLAAQPGAGGAGEE